MPADPVMFGADLFFARALQKHNFVLWTSPTSRPDLGGREADDNRLLSEFEENISVVQNRSAFYGDVCVELAIDSLAVSALLQASKIQEIEGASSAITFDVAPQASLQDMIGNNPSAALTNYDETALCSAAFRIMRSMVNNWLREVAIQRNVFADFQIVHFYRWVRSGQALLYDPALRRHLNNLMRKMFLQIVAEFQRLNAQIIYADYNRIVLNSGKKTIVDAITYVEYIVQSIRNKEMFHSINLTYQQVSEADYCSLSSSIITFTFNFHPQNLYSRGSSYCGWTHRTTEVRKGKFPENYKAAKSHKTARRCNRVRRRQEHRLQTMKPLPLT